MKSNIIVFFLFAASFASPLFAESTESLKWFPNDPYKVQIYTLNNGLHVYLSVYKNAPRIQTLISTKAGSKFDPADATGLAHYLEHMLFKGTDKIGTKDFAREQPMLMQIDSLFEVYRSTTDTARRSAIYHAIDSISYAASGNAIANEYDKMMEAIGAQGTNAFTTDEQTTYTEDIPSNEIENWLKIESERYRHPVFRLFHTELEAVYEEKNRGLDNDYRKVSEAMNAGLFQKHPYGTQTTIGTIAHLKNPSLKKIKDYYNTYYVPNNMAIFMAGDFDPDTVMTQIRKYFGDKVRKDVPVFYPPVEDPILQPIVKEVVGPTAERVEVGFRFGGAGSVDEDMLTVIDAVLSNGTAGLIDLNLVQAQKILSGGSYTNVMHDYSVHVLYATPRAGQSLDAAKGLMLEQIEKIKRGDFTDDLISSIITNMKYDRTKGLENNYSRVYPMLSAFVLDQPWDRAFSQVDRLEKITKQEIMEFAKAHYGNNYVVVYKRLGTDSTVQKVTKPKITPVQVNREEHSAFVDAIINSHPPDIAPVFVDYNRDLAHLTMKNNVPVLAVKNTENKTFILYYTFEMGTNNDASLGVAVNYLKYLGTAEYDADRLKREFFKLACSFNVFSSDRRVYVYLSGLSDNMNAAVALFEKLLANPKPDQEALTKLVDGILKKREDAKKSKEQILYNALTNYGKYGPHSPFTHVLSEKELRALTPELLVSKITGMMQDVHTVMYYGPESGDALLATLNALHAVPATLKTIPAAEQFQELDNTENNVYVVHYDMKQAEIMWLSKGDAYAAAQQPMVQTYNEYFGGGMSSILFQELRESKALAYSVYSYYWQGETKEHPMSLVSYIGAQADKLPEALAGMSGLLNDMPASESAFEHDKENILKNIRTQRTTREGILWSYADARDFGRDHDENRDVFETVPTLTLRDVQEFQRKTIRGRKYNLLVLGDRTALDMKTLAKYGTVKELTLEEVFGY